MSIANACTSVKSSCLENGDSSLINRRENVDIMKKSQELLASDSWKNLDGSRNMTVDFKF